ncbi:hypothetical protein LNQ81_12845 [Myroides sp. M-43]|uniref:hypothetical protein n=1 Tax=Myroides oncorhynchi TaxID=2893756 RepID=UPI001E2C51DA|nr:hypothetical protein [Myroides oncorhynchi]MCC9043561.1 hypothetical protein [Myroides oncorhynchi]
MKTKIYIQPYLSSDIDNSLVNEILNKNNYNVVRLINLYLLELKLKKTYKINCYLHNKEIETTVETTGNVLNINSSYVKKPDCIEEIIDFYCDILVFLELDINIDVIKKYVKESIGRKKIVFSKIKKNRFYSYEMFFTFKGIDKLLIGVNIYNQQGHFLREIAFMTTPLGVIIYDIIDNNIKKTSWFDNEHIKILKPNNVDYWLININGQVDFFYERAESGDAHGQYDLALMYKEGRGVLKNLDLYNFWINESAKQDYKKALELINRFI